MKRSHLIREYALFCIIIILGAVFLVGCLKGDTGDTGPAGPTGATGPAGPAGTDADVTATAETCAVCHGAGKIADIAAAHPDPTGKDVTISNIVLTNAGGTPTVSFHAATADGPVTDIVLNDLKFMIADLVPADTATADWGTWSSPYFERWAYESPPSQYGTYPQGTLTNNGNGDYSYVFDTKFTDATTEAPDYNQAQTQRFAMFVAGHSDGNGNAVTNNAAGFLDFVTPTTGGTVTTSVSQRMFVTADACIKCHGAPFQQAAHASTYLEYQGLCPLPQPAGTLWGRNAG